MEIDKKITWNKKTIEREKKEKLNKQAIQRGTGM